MAERTTPIAFERQGQPLMPEITSTRIVDGLGFGDGTISAAAQEQTEGNGDLAAVTDAALASPSILVAVDTDENGVMLQDDGCGDGRGVASRVGAVFTKGREFLRSLNRAKVFGGGATMGAATRIGLGQARGRTMQQTMGDAMADLGSLGIDFGAHTDNHAHGANCGCGAIDKAPQIVQAAAKYRANIAGVITGLGIDTEGLGDVQNAFDGYAAEIAPQDYSGRAVMDEIVENGKIVKELADDHRETRIVLNQVEGFTVDQEFVRRQTGGRAQVFAVDVWRLVKLSKMLHADAPAQQHKALLSELVYTLATAAVLTKGDLPVYAVAEANQMAAA